MCHPVCGMVHITLADRSFLAVHHILVEYNHLAQTRNYISSRCGGVESLLFHFELVFFNFN